MSEVPFDEFFEGNGTYVLEAEFEGKSTRGEYLIEKGENPMDQVGPSAILYPNRTEPGVEGRDTGTPGPNGTSTPEPEPSVEDRADAVVETTPGETGGALRAGGFRGCWPLRR
ncbi:MAG: hypothetical protein MAG715_00418 [Methanonatronarchaeales archaeon]|nr:hypothetical protein [Methanonatronarchaeales archaeon]